MKGREAVCGNESQLLPGMPRDCHTLVVAAPQRVHETPHTPLKFGEKKELLPCCIWKMLNLLVYLNGKIVHAFAYAYMYTKVYYYYYYSILLSLKLQKHLHICMR